MRDLYYEGKAGSILCPRTAGYTMNALVPVERVRVELGVIHADSPAELVAFASAVATTLAEVIEKQKLYSIIRNKKFVKCEGWTTLAAMLGVTPHETGVIELPDGIFVATVELRRINDGQPIARASAECGAPDELDRDGKPVWSVRPRYARRSMALTRATGKACRLAFSWVMVLAGFQPTPEEEIQEVERGGTSTASQPKVVSTGDVAGAGSHPAPTTPKLERLKMSEALPPNPIGPGTWKGKPLKEFKTEELVTLRRFSEKKGTDEYLKFTDQIDEVLVSREGEVEPSAPVSP